MKLCGKQQVQCEKHWETANRVSKCRKQNMKKQFKKCIRWHQMTLYSRQFQQTKMLPRSEGHHFFGSPYVHGHQSCCVKEYCHSVKDWAKSQILANSISKQCPFHFARHPISCDSDGAVFQDFHVLIQCCHSRSFISKHGSKAGTVLIVALDLALLYLRIIMGRSGQAIHSVRSRPSTLLGSSGSATNPIFCLDPKHPESQPKLHYSLQSLQVSCRPRLRGSAGPKSSGS